MSARVVRRARFAGLGLLGLVASSTLSRASMPTIDAAQLTRHAQTASTTVRLVPVTSQRKDAHGGVKCAVTTGKAAPVTDPTVRPQAAVGTRAVAAYAPDQPATPNPSAQGAALAHQTLAGSTGDVAAGLDAAQSSLTAAQLMFRLAAGQVGSAPTVMGALDLNSGARMQNGLAWNAVIGSANLWVTALNALNLGVVGDASRVAAAMRMSSAAASLLTAATP